MRQAAHLSLAALILAAGCHLALGLEPAAELESTTSTSEPECTDTATCNDDNPCTEDVCADGACAYQPLNMVAPDALQTSGDCLLAVCQQGALVMNNDDDDVVVDGLFCTDDTCSGGMPSNTPLAGGTACETGVCDGAGACVECFDDNQCTAPDTCGGGSDDNVCGCTPLTCASVGLTCGNAPNGCVGALNCDTGTMNGNESDVDCGGDTNTCPRRCSAGESCVLPSDCSSGDCTASQCVGN